MIHFLVKILWPAEFAMEVFDIQIEKIIDVNGPSGWTRSFHGATL